MPWAPELFSGPVLQEALDKRRWDQLIAVPYFDGLLAGDPAALVESFADQPEVHDPVRGRIKGAPEFERFVAETKEWLSRHNAWVEDVSHVITERHGIEEVVLHLEGPDGPTDLPFAIVADHADRRLNELRIYYSSWALTGRHAIRPPLLQPHEDVRPAGVVADYQRALASGDVDAILATFEAGGSAREPAGSRYLHSGPDDLRAFYEALFSNDGGIPLEHCTILDDGRTCAVEYNVVQWGKTQLGPQAGVAVYIRSDGGKLAAARIYDDVDPPIGPSAR